MAEAPFTYGSEANPDLLSRIPRDARLVLDIGCGAGALGAAWRRINARTRLVGVEPDPALAARAAPHYDTLLALDIEAETPPLAPGSADSILLGDVLEHLRDPWSVLRRLAPLLAEEGVLLVSIPNVEHWSFAARLLTGSFDYEEHGLYDRTHLRWFTPAMMARALAEAGLAPLEMAPRIFDAPQAEAMATALAPALRSLGVDPAAWAERAKPLQYVWRAVRQAPRPLLVAARPMADPVAAMAEVRVLQPLRDLATLPGIATVAAPDLAVPPGPPDLPRVMLVQRLFLRPGPESLGLVGAVRASGAVLVQEFDDDPERWPEIAGAGHMTFRGVHAVQTSTQALARELRAFNPEVEVFPNSVDVLPEPRNFADPSRLTLFFGALNREADIAPFLSALHAVLEEAGGRLAVHVIHDAATFEALHTPHKRFIPACGYDAYRAIMAGCELAFLPLAETRFNAMKSDLKAVEAASHGLCCLASPTVYGESLRDGETGIILRDPAALAATLRGLLANPEAARRIGLAAHRWVAEERLAAYQARRRAEWYRALWARRAALDAALAARLERYLAAAA